MRKIVICNLIVGSLLVASLQACIPAVIVAGAAAGGAVVYEKRDVKTVVNDRDISFKIQGKINNDVELSKNAYISVVTFNGVVLLVGQAKDERLRDRVLEFVNQVPNVKKVYNEITIGKPIPFSEHSYDSWLTTKVKGVLVSESGLNTTQMKIVTENKIVYLFGLVTQKQGQLAADVVKNIPEVDKVVKVFEYKD